MNNLIEDEIISIEELGEEITYDIEVSDDHLFLANGILTHNSADGKKMSGLNSISESTGVSATADVI